MIHNDSSMNGSHRETFLEPRTRSTNAEFVDDSLPLHASERSLDTNDANQFSRSMNREASDTPSGNMARSTVDRHDPERGSFDLKGTEDMEYMEAGVNQSGRELAIAHETMFTRRRLRAMLGCSLLFLTIIVLYSLALNNAPNSNNASGGDATGSKDGCDSRLSPPYVSNRTVDLTYCASHPAPSWVSLALTDGILPATKMGQSVVTFLVVGDFGRDGFCCQRDVAFEMNRAATVLGASFVINVGDSFYEGGILTETDEQTKTSFMNVYNQDYIRSLPHLSVLGNHEYRGSIKAVLDFSAPNRRFKMDNRYYNRVMRVNNLVLQLVFIDTTPMIGSYRISGYDSPDDIMLKRPDGIVSQWPLVETQMAWLEEKLSNNGAGFDMRIVIGHHPIYGLTSHIGENRTFLQQRVAPLLEKYNVTAYFAGHDHNMQFVQVNETAHFISGAGSKITAASASPDTPSDAVQYYYMEHGFLACSAYRDQLRVAVVDLQGNVLDQVLLNSRSYTSPPTPA